MKKKFKDFFNDYINFCHETKVNGETKPPSYFYDFFYLIFWPLPQMHEEGRGCWCCAAFRGCAYGAILGGVVGFLAGKYI